MARIKKEQIEFLNWEFGVFFHFGIRTFYEGHRDWDLREMPLDGFNPSNLDCGQWIKTVKEAGAKYAILVCKHHDGFANWPSQYTEYSVKNTPWKNGKGDVVKEFTDACGKYGVKAGLYYSPAEFGSKDKPNKDYDDYFISQISELLTNYGKIDYLWFDGCGSENHKYDEQRIIKVIRGLQPDILIFNMWDPDTRWVGNESGYAHTPNFNTVNSTSFSVLTETGAQDVLEEEKFLPVECDFRMRLHNWFYSDQDESTVKTLDELIGIYYYTVGRGANLLINIGPDRRGLLPEKDGRRLVELGDFIKRAFSETNLIPSDFVRTENAAKNAQNGEVRTSYICELKNPALINHCVIKETPEYFDTTAQFSVKAYPYEYGLPITVYEGRTIGHKAVCRFPAFFTKKVEVTVEKITSSENADKQYIQEISLYCV